MMYTGNNRSMRAKLTILALLMLTGANRAEAFELTYLAGASKIGINPSRFEPLYGFGIGGRLGRHLALETALFYSQRSIGSSIQADYFTFLGMPEFGYFGKKFAVYYAPGIALNPCLHHSNIENHTYLSFPQFIGAQINVKPDLMLEGRAGYDLGLTYGYFQNGNKQNYSGFLVQVGLKFRMR